MLILLDYYYVLSFPVARFAREKVQPLVREMDESSQMDKSIINGLFEQGVSGVAC